MLKNPDPDQVHEGLERNLLGQVEGRIAEIGRCCNPLQHHFNGANEGTIWGLGRLLYKC